MFPYNRDDAFISLPAESAASSFLRLEKKTANGVVLVVLDSACVVYFNSLIPGPKMTEMTSFLDFALI